MLRYGDALHVLQTGKEDFEELNSGAGGGGRGAQSRQNSGSKSQKTQAAGHHLTGSSQGGTRRSGSQVTAQSAAEDVFRVNCIGFCP